jgi:hypothetical protein
VTNKKKEKSKEIGVMRFDEKINALKISINRVRETRKREYVVNYQVNKVRRMDSRRLKNSRIDSIYDR